MCLLLGFDSRAIQLRGVRAASSHRLDGVGEGMKREAASGARAASSHRLDGVGVAARGARAASSHRPDGACVVTAESVQLPARVPMRVAIRPKPTFAEKHCCIQERAEIYARRTASTSPRAVRTHRQTIRQTAHTL